MRLQASRVGPLHLFANAIHSAGVHRVVRERAIFEQVLELAAVERVFEHGRQPDTDLWLVAVADSIDE